MSQSKINTANNQKAKRTRRRNWCFTDYTLKDLTAVYEKYDDIIRFVAWGVEKCPKTKRLHHQGWIQFLTPKDLGPVKRILGGKAHCEPCWGTEFENDKYCKKGGNYTCLGKFVSQGHRSDLEDIKKRIDSGGTMLEIWNAHPGDFVRYHPGFQKAIQLVQEAAAPSWRNVEVELYKGSTGTGKTRRAMESASYLIGGDELRWWDGYQGERTICIDEYANNVSCPTLLRLLDGYKKRLEIKGGHTWAQWTKVIITTNLTELHVNALEEHQEALQRRITRVIDFDVTE